MPLTNSQKHLLLVATILTDKKVADALGNTAAVKTALGPYNFEGFLDSSQASDLIAQMGASTSSRNNFLTTAKFFSDPGGFYSEGSAHAETMNSIINA